MFEARHGLARCIWRGLDHFSAYVAAAKAL